MSSFESLPMGSDVQLDIQNNLKHAELSFKLHTIFIIFRLRAIHERLEKTFCIEAASFVFFRTSRVLNVFAHKDVLNTIFIVCLSD